MTGRKREGSLCPSGEMLWQSESGLWEWSLNTPLDPSCLSSSGSQKDTLLPSKTPWNSHLPRSALREHGILLDGIEAVVHEPILVSRTNRVRVRELLLAQKRQVASGDKPSIFKEIRDRERPIRTALLRVLHQRQRSHWWSSSQQPQVIGRRTREFSCLPDNSTHRLGLEHDRTVTNGEHEMVQGA